MGSLKICIALKYYALGLMKLSWRWAFGKFGVRREGNRILLVIQEGKRQLGIYRQGWDGDTEVGIQETE